MRTIFWIRNTRYALPSGQVFQENNYARTVTIDPVTRIEGHAKITLQLDDAARWPMPASM